MATGGSVVTTQPHRAASSSATATTTINFANCKKVFVQRDYTEGCGVKFSTKFPPELEGRIDRQQFEFTVNMMNRCAVVAPK